MAREVGGVILQAGRRRAHRQPRHGGRHQQQLLNALPPPLAVVQVRRDLAHEAVAVGVRRGGDPRRSLLRVKKALAPAELGMSLAGLRRLGESLLCRTPHPEHVRSTADEYVTQSHRCLYMVNEFTQALLPELNEFGESFI